MHNCIREPRVIYVISLYSVIHTYTHVHADTSTHTVDLFYTFRRLPSKESLFAILRIPLLYFFFPPFFPLLFIPHPLFFFLQSTLHELFLKKTPLYHAEPIVEQKINCVYKYACKAKTHRLSILDDAFPLDFWAKRLALD